MTTISEPRAIPVGRQVRTGSARRVGDGLIRVVRWLGQRMRAIAVAGQLGPDPETEIGRWTGARI